MIAEFAPAKVNLTLRVGPPRADGYHPVDSLVAFADWGDTVRAAPGEGLSLILDGGGGDIPAGDDNLVLKAACALREAVGDPALGARLILEKHLPAAAGLGGGSADAAAALRALNRLWGLGLDLAELAAIGAQIGADVPVCVWSRPARMRGIGERVDTLSSWPAIDAVLVNPGVALSTASVFRAFDAAPPGALAACDPPPAGDALDRLGAAVNDLQPAAIALQPAIAAALAALSETKGALFARMSGSGATCFAVFRDGASAADAAAEIAASRPDWIVRAVRLGGAGED